MPIRKFQHVMVDLRIVLVHLSEDCSRVIECLHPPTGEEADTRNSDRHRAGKCKLGARKNANRHRGIFSRGEPNCEGSEVTSGEYVADLCRTRP